MVVCSPCKALIETAKLTIDLILTYILDLTLPPSCRRSRLSVLPRVTGTAQCDH